MASDKRFGPERRVKSRSDYLRIQSDGRKFRSEHFLLSLSGGRGGAEAKKESRLGVTITLKVHKRAVKRNRLRRRVRETFRACRDEFAFPADHVVIALGGAAELEFVEIQRELGELWRKAKLLPQSRGSQ